MATKDVEEYKDCMLEFLARRASGVLSEYIEDEYTYALDDFWRRMTAAEQEEVEAWWATMNRG